uniref:Uncharacterized protein n=1 Tax=uncultured Desulfobacterium sp. TaxID=201089 RepID=E1YLY7_9BACT|nr:unknown protein [uncultured Desulfobacterium sp.]
MNGVQGVGGSNPLAPTRKKIMGYGFSVALFFMGFFNSYNPAYDIRWL